MSLFYNSNIEINEKIFEPREETEKIVDITLKYLKDKMDILELGTGSGAISISLIKKMPNLNITATDISVEAIKCARKNSVKNNVNEKIDFIKSDWFNKLDSSLKYDIIVSNPPYIPIENKKLYKDLRDPKNSLFAKDYGFFEIKNILKHSSEFMKKKAFLILEHSHHHTLQFDKVLRDYNLKKVITEQDIYGYDRFTVIKNF